MDNQIESRKRKNPYPYQEKLNDRPNLTPKTNPLFVELVVENIFKLLKGKENVLKLGPYRLVCKLWDWEISKLIRRETKINLETLLFHYPNGMGWTAFGTETNFQYIVPFQNVRPFKNINLTRTCWGLFYEQEEKLEKWFQLMGSHVKSLCFEFGKGFEKPLYLKFLEKVLKEWCPNLESIAINGTLQINQLIFASGFTDLSKEIKCKGLKEVKLSGQIQGDITWNTTGLYPSILTDTFNKFIYQHGLPRGYIDFPACNNGFGAKVLVPRDLMTKPDFPDVSQFIPENFFPVEWDGGILGQLMNCTLVQKFSMIENVHPVNFKKLVAFFHYQKNCWRSSLKILELYISQMKNISEQLVVFAKIKYPLTTIIFKEDFDHENPATKMENMTRFLAYFADTLERLEYRGTINWDRRHSTPFVLPALPKLQTFCYENNFDCPLCPINVLTNLPNLEKFHLKISPSNFSNESNQIYNFFDIDTGNVTNNKLRDLSVTIPLSGTRTSNVLKWFPKVQTANLSVCDIDDGINILLEKIAVSELKHLKITFSKTTDEAENSIKITEYVRQISRLKSFENFEIGFAQ